jgi:hypothetical protein
VVWFRFCGLTVSTSVASSHRIQASCNTIDDCQKSQQTCRCLVSRPAAMSVAGHNSRPSPSPLPRTRFNGTHLMDLCVHELLPLLASGVVSEIAWTVLVPCWCTARPRSWHHAADALCALRAACPRPCFYRPHNPPNDRPFLSFPCSCCLFTDAQLAKPRTHNIDDTPVANALAQCAPLVVCTCCHVTLLTRTCVHTRDEQRRMLECR